MDPARRSAAWAGTVAVRATSSPVRVRSRVAPPNLFRDVS
jgi:hypothetical protein